MTAKRQELIDELIKSLPDAERPVYENIVGYLVGLGYIPQRSRAYISFKHRINNKVIAKMRRGDIKIKFFACTYVPPKYTAALREEADLAEQRAQEKSKRKGGAGPGLVVPPPDDAPLPEGAIMKKCTLACGVCSGGQMRYYHIYPDGKEIFRCGAYPVSVPEAKACDVDELKRLLAEQHKYFLSIP